MGDDDKMKTYEVKLSDDGRTVTSLRLTEGNS